MTLSRILLLQKVSRNLLHNASFYNKWVPLSSLKKGLDLRYKFNTTYPINEISLSKAIDKIEPMIESLVDKQSSGLHREKYKGDTLYYQQKNDLDSPSFFTKATSPRDFGLGLRSQLIPTIFTQINCVRRNQQYTSADNAILINGNAKNSNITDDPTLRFFHAGVSHEDY